MPIGRGGEEDRCKPDACQPDACQSGRPGLNTRVWSGSGGRKGKGRRREDALTQRGKKRRDRNKGRMRAGLRIMIYHGPCTAPLSGDGCSWDAANQDWRVGGLQGGCTGVLAVTVVTVPQTTTDTHCSCIRLLIIRLRWCALVCSYVHVLILRRQRRSRVKTANTTAAFAGSPPCVMQGESVSASVSHGRVRVPCQCWFLLRRRWTHAPTGTTGEKKG